MWNVVNLAAISVSADLLELWFLGDLLGILCVSEVVFFFFLNVFGLVIFGAVAFVFGLSCFSWLWSLGVLEGRRYCG